MRGQAMALLFWSLPIVLIATTLASWQTGAMVQPVPIPTSAALPPPPRCPVTLPTSDAPPGIPAPSEPMYHGNGELWTTLWRKGQVFFEPGGSGFVLPDGSLGMKWPWIPSVPGELTVNGRRLDGPAAPLKADIDEGFTEYGRFFPTYLIFSTEGCWEVTGRVGEARLTFVTLVVKVGEGPNWRPPTAP